MGYSEIKEPDSPGLVRVSLACIVQVPIWVEMGQVTGGIGEKLVGEIGIFASVFETDGHLFVVIADVHTEVEHPFRAHHVDY